MSRRIRRGLAVLVASLTTLAFPGLAVAAEGPNGSVSLTPEPDKLPGSSALQSIINGTAGILLGLCLLAVIGGAGLWGIFHHSGNPHHASRARAAALAGVAGALVIAAGPALINWAVGLGSGVK